MEVNFVFITIFDFQKKTKSEDFTLFFSESKSTSMKEARCKPILCRRNTLDTIIFDKMCGKADEDREKKSKEEAIKEGSRKCKRSLKLTRGVERDLKLDVETAREYSQNKNSNGITKLPNHIKLLSGIVNNQFFVKYIFCFSLEFKQFLLTHRLKLKIDFYAYARNQLMLISEKLKQFKKNLLL